MLATSGDDGAFAVWAPDTGEKLLEVQRPGGRADRDVGVWGPSFSPDGTRVAAAWPDAVRVIDLATKRTVVEIRADDPSSTAFSPDGKRVAYGGRRRDGHGRGRHHREGALHAVRGDGDAIRDLAWSPDGRWIATAGGDGTARVWDGSDRGAPVHDPRPHRADLGARLEPGRHSPGHGRGRRHRPGLGDHRGRLRGPLFTFSAQDTSRGGGFGGVAFSPDGQRLMAGDSAITSVTIWDAADHGRWRVGERRGRRPTSRPTAGAWSWAATTAPCPSSTPRPGSACPRSRGRRAARTPSVWLLDLSDDGELLATLGPQRCQRHGRRDRCAAVHRPVGRRRLGAGHDLEQGQRLARHRLRHRRPAGGRWSSSTAPVPRSPGCRRFPGTTRGPSASAPTGGCWRRPDGGSRRSTRRGCPRPIWDWERGEVVDRVDTSAELVEFDPTGALIATSRPVEGVADVWDARTGERTATLTATAHVLDLAFDASGTRLATAHADGTVRLWDPETGVQEPRAPR